MAGIDRRAARTRRALHQALMTLILRKGYDAITVQDITAEADVGRSTFYAHYAGKEELFRGGFAMLRAELTEAQRRPRTDGEPALPLRFSRAMFEHAAAYADVFRALAGGRGGTVALNAIRQVLAERVLEELPAAEGREDIARELRVQFVVSSFLTVLSWWLERQPSLPPAAADAMFRRLALRGLGSPAA